MTREHSLRDETDRLILLIGAAVDSFQTEMDGRERGAFKDQINKFLTEATPESGLQPEGKFPSPLRQLKDRGCHVRALGTWCQGDDYDLFITLVIYYKTDTNNEIGARNKIGCLLESGELQSLGNEYKNKFDNQTASYINKKRKEWKEREDLIIFTP